MRRLLCAIGRALGVVGLVFLTGCSPKLAYTFTERATAGYTTAVHADLVSLPPPKEKIVIAVYKFRDQTGQYKTSAQATTFSTAVTQGATSMLIKALEDSGWFTVIEREALPNLLNERNIIRSTRLQYAAEGGEQLGPVPPLLYAGVLLEGGIIGYDTNLITGGLGVAYLGFVGSGQMRCDQITIYLRLVSTQNGQILKSMSVSKSVLSREVDFGVYRFVRTNALLEAETGLSTNEPPTMCALEAIEKGVYDLILDGILDGLWAVKYPEDMNAPAIQTRLAERQKTAPLMALDDKGRPVRNQYTEREAQPANGARSKQSKGPEPQAATPPQAQNAGGPQPQRAEPAVPEQVVEPEPAKIGEFNAQRVRKPQHTDVSESAPADEPVPDVNGGVEESAQAGRSEPSQRMESLREENVNVQAREARDLAVATVEYPQSVLVVEFEPEKIERSEIQPAPLVESGDVGPPPAENRDETGAGEPEKPLSEEKELSPPELAVEHESGRPEAAGLPLNLKTERFDNGECEAEQGDTLHAQEQADPPMQEHQLAVVNSAQEGEPERIAETEGLYVLGRESEAAGRVASVRHPLSPGMRILVCCLGAMAIVAVLAVGMRRHRAREEVSYLIR